MVQHREDVTDVRKSRLLAITGLILIAAVMVLDFLAGRPMLRESPPTFDVMHLLRSVLLIVASGLMVLAVIRLPERLQRRDAGSSRTEEWGRWGWIGWMRHAATRGEQVRMAVSVKEVVVWGLLAINVLFILIFIVRPIWFHRFSDEDNIVELISAALLLGTVGILGYSILQGRHLGSIAKAPFILAGTGLAGGIFLIAMEEVSWFQRVIGIETPEAFASNLQGEMNLHNFATGPTENAYYLGAFLFLVFLAFVHDRTNVFDGKRWMALYVPGPFVLLSSSIMVAYTYDMFDIVFGQIMLYMTMFILLAYGRQMVRAREHRSLPLTIALCLLSIVFTQLLFIVAGDRFVVIWDVTEYREFFIPAAFLLYSVEVAQRVEALKRNSDSRRVAGVRPGIVGRAV